MCSGNCNRSESNVRTSLDTADDVNIIRVFNGMKATSREWGNVIELAEKLAFSQDILTERKARQKYFRYLSRLRKKYGPEANIIASAADFYKSNSKAIKALIDAYHLSEQNQDYKNCTWISSSIAHRYLNNHPINVQEGCHWTKKLKKDLTIFFDDSCADELHSCIDILQENDISVN